MLWLWTQVMLICIIWHLHVICIIYSKQTYMKPDLLLKTPENVVNCFVLQNEIFNKTLPVIWSISAIRKGVIQKGDLMVHCPYSPYITFWNVLGVALCWNLGGLQPSRHLKWTKLEQKLQNKQFLPNLSLFDLVVTLK